MVRRLSKAGLQPVMPILAQALRQAGLDRVMLLAQIIQHWEKIAGAQIAAVAQPEHIRSRVLFVTVVDAIWLQQITFYQSQLLRNIRRVLGDVPLSKLHFALNSRLPEPKAQEENRKAFLPLTAEEEQQVLQGTADIADTALRVAVQRAWRRDWQLKTRG